MALPTPTRATFPAPTGPSFPAPTALQNPMFGVNPFTPGTNMLLGPTQFVDPDLGVPDLAARHAAQVQQIQMAQLASMGLAPATDPHTWTPQEAADQTDSAIAKIATVNPEAAAKLMEQRAPTEDDGASFWDSLKHVAGEILSPALNIGGKVLDIIGRTANIVPNVAFDMVDGGKTDVWGDIGGALTGNTKHNWNSVFQEMGWEGGGIGGFLRATVGLAGDIATDPLTWLVPAGAGVKSAEAAATAGKVAATESESILGRYAALVGDNAGERALSNYESLTTKMAADGVKMGESDTAERVTGIINAQFHETEREVLAKQFELSDKVFRAQRSRSLSTLLRGGGVYSDSGELLASTQELRGAWSKVISAGHEGSTEWAQARQLASSLGGARFKFQLPFTNLRYISPAIPGSKYLSEKSFGVFSRFMAGQSGMNRMASYIAAHPDEGWAPMKTWMEQGFEVAAKQHPEAVAALRGKFKNLGSMFYSASEQMGRITAHFDSTAIATRAGLGGYIAAAGAQNARSKAEQIAREVAYQVADKDGNQLTREMFLRKLESNLGVSFRKKYDVATPEQLDRWADYLDTFPKDLDTSDPAAVAAWFDSQPQNFIGPQSAEQVAKRDDDIRFAQELAASVTPAERETLGQVAAVWDHLRNEVAKRDGSLGDVGMGFGEVGKLTPEQAEQAVTGTQLPETVWFTPADAQASARVRQVGVTVDDVASVDDWHGVHGDISASGGPTSAGAVPTRMKVTNPLYMDESEAGALLEEKVIQADDEAARITESTHDMVDAAREQPAGTSAATGKDLQDRAQMITEKIRKEHPENDAVIIKRADGSVHVVLFDPTNVWAVDKGASNMVAERGFLHRTFTSEAKAWLRGKPPLHSEGKMLIAEPHLEAFLARETLHMNRREAETFMHDYLTRRYGAEGIPDRIWENNILKVHEAYVANQTEAIASEMLGRNARRITLLNDIAPAMFGSAPRDQKYAWAISPTLLTALKSKDTALVRAIMKSHAADYARLEEQQRQLARDAEQYGGLATAVEEALANGTDAPDRIITSARRYGATVADAQASIDSQLAELDRTQDHLLAQLFGYDQGFGNLPETNASAHPKSADLIVTRNADGTTTVKGWHFSAKGGLNKVQDVDPRELGSAGFHVGHYAQSVQLAEQWAKTNGTTIGSRDGHDWAQVIHVLDADGNELRAIAGDDIRRLPNETTEEAALREVQGATRVEVESVQPANFYEDMIEPVEARGKFVGTETPLEEGPLEVSGVNYKPEDVQRLKKESDDAWKKVQEAVDTYSAERGDGPLVPGARAKVTKARQEFDRVQEQYKAALDAEDNGFPQDASTRLGASFSGSGPGETAGKTFERERIAGMEGGGTHGAIYNNAFEGGGGRSLVVLDPRDANVVWTARGPANFEDAVAEGKVFLTKDGEVTLKRVAGSKRLKPREHTLDQLSRVRAEREDLGTLRTRLRDGLSADALETDSLGKKVEGSAKSFGQAVAARAKREGQEQFAAGKRLARARERTHAAMTEANKAYAEAHGAVAAVKPSLVKVETAGDLGGLTRLHVPGLEGFAMPSYMAEEFHSMVDKHGIGGLRTAWRQYVIGPWKRWATYRWPGFHVRNFFGAFFNNWLGGVEARDYIFSWRVNHARDGQLKWADKAVSDWELHNYGLAHTFAERPTYSQVADLLSAQGIGRANTMAVMGIGSTSAALHDGLDAIGKDASKVRSAARKADGLMKSMGSSVEDFHRVAAWGRGMAATNGDTYGARAFVMMRHGDYSDLTGAEDFVRDLVPFYKWQRTNIPYQLRMLAENPAKLTLVHEKLPRYAADAQGLDQTQVDLQKADWMKETTAIPIPSWVPVVGSKDKDALKFAMFDLPYSDLYNGLNDYLSSGLPIVRNVLESYGFKQTLFSGKELSGKYVPLSGVFNLPGVRDVLSAAKVAQKGADGQLYMEDKMQNVLMGWPIFSRFRNFTESDPDRVDARTGGLFSMMAGVGVRQGDYTSAELDFFYNEVQPLMDQYKSLGIQLPTADDIQSGEVGGAVGLFNQSTNLPFALA